MLRQLLITGLLLLSTSCSSSKQEDCWDYGCIPEYKQVELQVHPNSCKGDCNFETFPLHKGFSVDTASYGKVWIQHNDKGGTVKVPSNHKLIACFCNQPECIITDPNEPQLTTGVINSSNRVNLGGLVILKVQK